MSNTLAPSVIADMCKALEGASAMCDLLHAHARGQTDLTEDQLAAVVTGVSREAGDALSRARGAAPEGQTVWMPPHRSRWVKRARRWAARQGVRLDA